MSAPYKRRMRLIPGSCPVAANGRGTGQAARPPVMSCTTWGFSCPGPCAPGGGLLPRLFTLTRSLARPGGLIFCDTFRRPWLGPGAPACSTRHGALRCSDFPPGRSWQCQRRRAIVCPPHEQLTHRRGAGQGESRPDQSVANRNHATITTPMTSFPAIPAMLPIRVPHVERPAGSNPWPPSNSPTSTPASGPRNSPTGP